MIDKIMILGYVAAVFSTGSFYFQAWKSWKTKKAEDVSLLMYIIIIAGAILWLVFGILIEQPPMIWANIFALVAMGATLYLKIRHG